MAYFLDAKLNALTVAENSREKTYGALQSGASAPKRVNAYPGKCVRCTGWVPKGKGTATKRGPKWEVTHETCP